MGNPSFFSAINFYFLLKILKFNKAKSKKYLYKKN